jgi:L-histidine N-alpha-methyltransferase
MTEQFAKDVDTGLSATEKTLPSKYFYDERGDELFIEIMHLPEYYVTRSELEIFQTRTQEIIESLHLNPETYFELLELGPGDGLKTKELLRILEKQKYKFDYFPIDISQNALDNLELNLKNELPDISVQKKQGDYFKVLESIKNSKNLKVVLFLGSNIGNMPDKVAADFIYRLGANLRNGDKLLLGVDLLKPESIVLPAYNDSKGVTAEFNFNLLKRINAELGGNFNLNNFIHKPEYSEKVGIVKSYLESSVDQIVYIEKLDKTFCFANGEKMLTEISRKYDDEILNKIIEKTDFKITGKLSDSKNYFTDYIMERDEN